MKKIMLSLVCAALAFGASAEGATRADKIRAKLDGNDRNYVFVTMHRGDWRHYPENSRDAIIGAINHGADVVELDVCRTKDGRFVLLHDRKLDRVTEGKGKVADHTLAEIKKLHLRENQGGKNAKFTDCGDMVVDGVHYQVKFNKATFTDERTLHNLAAA